MDGWLKDECLLEMSDDCSEVLVLCYFSTAVSEQRDTYISASTAGTHKHRSIEREVSCGADSTFPFHCEGTLHPKCQVLTKFGADHHSPSIHSAVAACRQQPYENVKLDG